MTDIGKAGACTLGTRTLKRLGDLHGPHITNRIDGIPDVPLFPLGGFTPLQSSE